MQEQQNYGAYTGNQANHSYQAYNDGPPSAYAPPNLPQNDMYDDAFIDSLSLRLSQRMAQGPVGKIKTQNKTSGRATAGQKLALAIVSLCLFMVIVLALVQNSTVTGFLAVVGIGIAGIVFIAVNGIFDNLA